jgi:hypothetical protein
MEPLAPLFDGRPVVHGLVLRSLLVLVLLDAGRPMTLGAMTSAAERRGFAFGSAAPGKEAADALRWEVARGRVVRVGRGVYAAGTVAKVTKHRMRARVAAAARGGGGA